MKTLRHNSNGAAVFWRAAPSFRSKFAGLAQLGLDRFIPPQRTEEALLHDALKAIFAGPTVLIRRLNVEGGYTVIEEHRGETRNRYTTHCTCKWADSKLEIDAPDAAALERKIIDAMKDASDKVTALSVTQSLVKLVDSLGGIALRPGGAVYWILNERLDEWAAAAPIYEKAAQEPGGSCVYIMKTVADPNAIDAVCDALATDTQKHIDALAAEIREGTLGPSALRSRAEDIARLRERMGQYAGALGKGMDSIAKMIDEAETANAQALMLASAKAEAARAEKAAKKGAK